jgi:hypothetical protein
MTPGKKGTVVRKLIAVLENIEKLLVYLLK